MQNGELSDLKPGLEISFSTCKGVEDTLQKHLKRSPHNPWVFIRDISLNDVRHLNESFQTSSRSDYYIDLQLAVFYLKVASYEHEWIITKFTKLMNRRLRSANITDSDYSWWMNRRFTVFRREKNPDGAFFSYGVRSPKCLACLDYGGWRIRNPPPTSKGRYLVVPAVPGHQVRPFV